MDMHTRLISPVNEAASAPICAARPAMDTALSVLLVDGMLNQKAGWGQALLDGAQEALRIYTIRRFDRIVRPPHGSSLSEEWARTRLGHTDLAIIAVGD